MKTKKMKTCNNCGTEHAIEVRTCGHCNMTGKFTYKEEMPAEAHQAEHQTVQCRNCGSHEAAARPSRRRLSAEIASAASRAPVRRAFTSTNT